MKTISKVSLAIMALLSGVVGANALEGQFDRPHYKNSARLDFCFTFGQACGQRVADQYCTIKGYQRASRFQTEKHSPTQIMANGQICEGGHCTTFKNIVCFTSERRPGRGTDWPQGL